MEIRVVMLVLVVLGIGWNTGAAQNRGSTQSKEKSSGIPACDTFFAMADRCLASKKMSAEDQKTTEATVSRLRAMLPIAASPQGRATLADRCTKSLEQAQQNDKYGCYTPDKKPDTRDR